MSTGILEARCTHKTKFQLKGHKERVLTFHNPSVMGIINVSPESFYGFVSKDQVVDKVADMIEAGASIIDVGGEATSPHIKLEEGSVSLEQELERVVPAVEAIRQRFDIALSVDTSQAQVMSESIDAGVDMINDQRALQGDGTLNIVAKAGVSVCLMHFFNNRTPGSTQKPVMLQQILKDLKTSVERCKAAGLGKNQLIIDVGFGQGNYGKNCEENYYLMSRLPEFSVFDCPILSGWSRKSMVSDVLGGVPPDQRLYGSLAAAVIAVLQGASIIRTHDVKATVDALSITRYAMNSDLD